MTISDRLKEATDEDWRRGYWVLTMGVAYLILAVWFIIGYHAITSNDAMLAFIGGTFAGPAFALAARYDLTKDDI